MKYIFLTVLAFATLVAPTRVSAQTAADPAHGAVLDASLKTTAVINPGDAVQIIVWRKPEWSGEFLVANDGAIVHPLYQMVRIAGVSPEVATERVRAFLEQYEASPSVRVDPIYRVSISGEVRQPKLYKLRPETTISEAIHEAGGPTERGRMGHVRLYRDGEMHRLHLGGVDATAAEVLIQSGDRIVVERRVNLLVDVVRPTVSFVGSIASITYAWRRFRR